MPEEKPNNKEITDELGGEFSLKEIDTIIQDDNPEFVSSLGEIQDDLNEDQEFDSVDFESLINEDDSKLTRLKKITRRLRLSFKKFVVWGNYILDGLVEWGEKVPQQFSKNLISLLKSLIFLLKRNYVFIKESSWKNKILMIAFVVLIFLFIALIQLLYKGSLPGFISKKHFIGSMAEVANGELFIDIEESYEGFFDSYRYKRNVFLLPRVIVNLRPSQGSTDNPMGIFEFYIVGMSAEPLIEIKNREHEILDYLQRVIEEYSYDQLNKISGKESLKKLIVRELNTHLSSGRVKETFIKTIVLKK